MNGATGPSSAARPFAWINQTYGLDVQVGDELLFCGKKGVVVEDHGDYVGVRMFGSPHVGSIHPTWNVEYLPTGRASSGAGDSA